MKTQQTVASLAEFLGGRYEGDPDCPIQSLATLWQAGATDLTFLDNRRYARYLPETKAAAVILVAADVEDCPTNAIIVDNPYAAYARVATLFTKREEVAPGVHPTAVIGDECHIDPSASIGAHTVLGRGVTVGANAVIGPGCVLGADSSIGAESRLIARITLYEDVMIGERVLIHAGAVIGSDGFGFAKDKGQWIKIPQIGTVRVGNDVEIGANTTIDCGALGDTVIGDEAKLDNQIQVAHNVHIGERTAIAGCTGIAGSSEIGQDCLIGGAVSILGHLKITDNVAVTATSSVSKSITKPGIYSSAWPAQPHAEWNRFVARLRKLTRTLNRLKSILPFPKTPESTGDPS